MRHIELLETLYKNRETIIAIEKGEYREDLNTDLVNSDFFVKFGDKIILNEKYQDFINFMLQRVDYGIIFGDYEYEHKELIDRKTKFLKNDSNQYFYLNQILQLIQTLFSRFRNKDREIALITEKLENETNNLNAIINIAEDALDNIREFSTASGKVGNLLRTELKGIHEDIDKALKPTNYEILTFHKNIHKQIERILFFIVSRKDRIRENKKLAQITESILTDKDDELENHLILKSNQLFFTIYQEQRLRHNTFPQEDDLSKLTSILSERLNIEETKREEREVFFEAPKVEKIDIPDIEKIVQELNQDKSEDIFLTISNHIKLENSIKSDVFKLFFKIVTYKKYRKNIRFTNIANSEKIRIVKWV